MRDGPSTIESARWKHARAQKHSDCFALVFTLVDLKIEVHALAIVAAVLIVVDVRAKCDVLSVWYTTVVSTSNQGLVF
ncbi:MAG TPA: hypothetical protein VFN26_08385 [Candidatus Acidoferrum sp.]|nr:hypothetical protein [Candidatus Acidoferrum sp.]